MAFTAQSRAGGSEAVRYGAEHAGSAAKAGRHEWRGRERTFARKLAKGSAVKLIVSWTRRLDALVGAEGAKPLHLTIHLLAVALRLCGFEKIM